MEQPRVPARVCTLSEAGETGAHSLVCRINEASESKRHVLPASQRQAAKYPQLYWTAIKMSGAGSCHDAQVQLDRTSG